MMRPSMQAHAIANKPSRRWRRFRTVRFRGPLNEAPLPACRAVLASPLLSHVSRGSVSGARRWEATGGAHELTQR
jgi:hypothetical protein